MRSHPAIGKHAEFKAAVATWLMILLTNIGQADARFMVARHGESYRIPLAFARKTWTRTRVAKIALFEFSWRGDRSFTA